MSDEPTPDGQVPAAAPVTDDTPADAPAPIEPTTDEQTPDELVTDEPTDEPTSDEPATVEPVTATATAPPRRSIARDVALVAVVFVAVFILLGGLLWLAVPSGDRGATKPSPTSTPRSVAGPTHVATATSSAAGPAPSDSGSLASASADPSAGAVLVGAGDIADCGLDADAATARLLDDIDGTVFTAGDNAYPDGTSEQFRTCYGSTWGRHLARTKPAPGNHDWGTKDLAGYLGYFGAAAAPDGKSWYSYDLGTWHMIVLDSDCTSVGGCGPATDQGHWLAADLGASTARCTLAIWHHPRFSSGEHGNDPSVAPFWTALYDAGADVVVNGHDHDYERFAAQNPDGRPDAARGLREFVVGTGGAALRSFPNPAANSERRDNTHHGVIRFVLRPTSYDWTFLPTSGGSVDSGNGSCHDVSCPSMSMDQARVVVIGGGITGCSVAYHLALAGWTDVLLVEKAQLTAGSTCQAAGLVTAFNPSSTMMTFRRYSIELYGHLGAFEAVGSLRLASSPDQLRELERTASRARGIGLEAEVIGAEEARRLMPAISPDDLYGAVHLAGDGYLDPHGATHAVADAARALGVRIRTGVRVTGIELSPRREVTAVLTEDGPIATEIVVNAAGMWAPQVAAMVGAFIPSTPVDHQHVALKAVPGHELSRDMPCFRDPDNLVYGKSEQGGMVFGGYETDPVSRWEDGVPWDHAARSLPPDWERFAPLMAGAIRRFPFLADAEAIRLVCHPDAMTPDANPLLGPLPGVRGFWVAAGLSLNGFGGGGGIGRAIAGWITAGDPGIDIGPYRAWRFGEVYRDTGFASGRARETYSDYYRLRYPFDADVAGRPKRRSALHGRLQEAGAVFGTKAGWERADHHEPGRPWRRSGRDQAIYGWTKPPWFDRVLAEGRAVRERAGIVDLSSFGKIAVEGPGALGLLQRVSANDIDRPVGSVIYTQWCDERGGMVADVTVTRLAADRFRIVTGAGYLASEMAWLRTHLADDAPVAIRDDSAALTTIGLWGPRARDILAAVALDDVGDEAIPLRRARNIQVGPAPVLASRISYAGELGWELTTDAEWAVGVWHALTAAGQAHGLEPFGYRALDALRMEKGYRYFGTDLTMLDTPDEAGLGAFVRLAAGQFIGRDALVAARGAQPDGPSRLLRTVRVGEAGYLPIYGGEAVRHESAVIGRLRSVAYGPTIEGTIAYAYLPAIITEGADLEVDVFDRRVSALVAPDVLVDPAGLRMRG